MTEFNIATFLKLGGIESITQKATAVVQRVKTLLASLAYHIGVLLESELLHLQSSSLVHLGRPWRVVQVHGPLPPTRNTGWSSKPLALP